MDFASLLMTPASTLLHETSVGKMWQFCFTYACALLAAVGVHGQYGSHSGGNGASTYTNPVLNKTGADP